MHGESRIVLTRNRHFAASTLGGFWSPVAFLSVKRVEENGARRALSDLTRGGWQTTRPLGSSA